MIGEKREKKAQILELDPEEGRVEGVMYLYP